MSRHVWILIVCVALTACVTVQPATQQTELEVQQASDQFSATRERGDASSFAARFTEDGIFMVPGLSDAAGRSAVRELAQRRFTSGRINDLKIHRREIQVIGDSAYELAWYSETDRRQEQSFRLQGRHFILWKRGSDKVWRVHRYLYNFSDATPLP
ncbi:MAG TPA: SgcJ/EcaC family oxidoreductase [Thermoanaerobaculia bacterium]